MNKVIFGGCSFTAGAGWEEKSNAPELWTNLCCNNIEQLKNLEQVNLGVIGASNTDIFESTMSALAEDAKNIKYVICQWTATHRYSFYSSLEPWETKISWKSKNKNDDCELLNRFIVRQNMHYEILKIVKYSAIITNVCKHLNIIPIFLNGLCPWDKNYFDKIQLPSTKPEDYTPFTKYHVLDIDQRNDKDINTLYNKIHADYQAAGGIDPKNWVNLYRSMFQCKIDVNSDQQHPGSKSNQIYFEQVKNFLSS